MCILYCDFHTVGYYMLSGSQGMDCDEQICGIKLAKYSARISAACGYYLLRDYSKVKVGPVQSSYYFQVYTCSMLQ